MTLINPFASVRPVALRLHSPPEWICLFDAAFHSHYNYNIYSKGRQEYLALIRKRLQKSAGLINQAPTNRNV